MVAIEACTEDSVRDARPGELAGGLMDELATMGEDADAAALTNGPADDIRKDDGLAGSSRRNVADRSVRRPESGRGGGGPSLFMRKERKKR
jgi:hypothetical protein